MVTETSISNQRNNNCRFKFKQEQDQKQVPLDKNGVRLNNPDYNNYIRIKYSNAGTLLLSLTHSAHNNYDQNWRTTGFLSRDTQIIGGGG